MSQPTHTPGEWVAHQSAGRKRWTVVARGVLGGSGRTSGAECFWDVARVMNGAPGDSLETGRANARLIADAKIMLALLAEIAAVSAPVEGQGLTLIPGGTLARIREMVARHSGGA